MTMLRGPYWTLFARCLHVASLSETTVDPKEVITRFLFQGSHFAVTTGRVNPTALMPYDNKNSKRRETSIIRTDGLQDREVWELGYQIHEVAVTPRPIKARAVGVAAIVIDQQLQFDINGNPYPRHADIIGWPVGDEKHARLALATEIANRMTLEVDTRPQKQ